MMVVPGSISVVGMGYGGGRAETYLVQQKGRAANVWSDNRADLNLANEWIRKR